MTNRHMAYLALIRHGESEYNVKGWWTGWDNPPLTERGHSEAKMAGEEVKHIHWNEAFVSDLMRAQDTLSEIKKVINQEDLPTTISSAIKERDYGDFTAKNKWDIQKELGEEKFQEIRRSWDVPPTNGESLKDVYDREIPYFEAEILPKLQHGENIIVASSGNALRALVKYLENVSETEIPKLEIATGQTYLYELDDTGKVLDKKILGEKIVHTYKQ